MIPSHAPFQPEQRRQLEALLTSMDATQKAWLSGFLAAAPGTVAVAVPAAKPAGKLTVLYGTESGNAERLADSTVKEAKKHGLQAALKSMADITPATLAKAENILVIVSTWGDGEPPESATSFYKDLMSNAHALKGVRFSVCALGDTSYEKFCQTGKDIDNRLAELGAERVHPRQDCDVEFEEPYQAWLTGALKSLTPASNTAAVEVAAAASIPAATVAYGKSNPFGSELLEKVLLNGTGSKKETVHYEFSLAGSGLAYEPGDALAVVPVNAPDVVQELVVAAKLTGTETVEVKGEGSLLLADALREKLDITALSRAVLTKIQALAKSPELEVLLAEEAKDKLKEYIYGRHVADAIADFFPNGIGAAELVSVMRKLPPRLYSIASSPLAHPDEVHLTIASVRYDAHGKARKGVASTYLADLVDGGSQVPVYVHQNKNFRLPTDGNVSIIMVGPGTGVAPFRAFVEHRAATGATGGNWLFFGDQHYTYDFLYQLEWQDHLKEGALTKLDVAFSRDQPEKIYVQDKMRAQAAELWRWLEQGAHFYVCGDASRMAHDVHEALLDIVAGEGKMTREAAEAWVEDLKKSKRYQRDVY